MTSVESIDGKKWMLDDCSPFFIVFADANGENRFMQCYGPSAREAVGHGLKQFEHEDGGEFEPTQYCVVHIFPGYVGRCIAHETMSPQGARAPTSNRP